MKRTSNRADVRAQPNVELFMLLAQIRGANAESLHALFFAPRKIPFRTMMRRLADLVAAGHLARARMRGSRSIYHLTSKSLAMVATRRPGVSEILRRRPRGRQADHCWLRSAYWAALKRDGFNVGRGMDELLTLRRWLIDEQAAQLARTSAGTMERVRGETAMHMLRTHPHLQPVFRFVCDACAWRGRLSKFVDACARCAKPPRCRTASTLLACVTCGAVRDGLGEHTDRRDSGKACSGRLRVVDALPFDVAWRRRGGRFEVLILFVDNPSLPLKAQIAELPLGMDGQPKVSIILRSVDPDSCVGASGKGWLSVGARHRALLAAFQRPKRTAVADEDDDEGIDGDSIAATVNVIDPYPALHVHG